MAVLCGRSARASSPGATGPTCCPIPRQPTIPLKNPRPAHLKPYAFQLREGLQPAPVLQPALVLSEPCKAGVADGSAGSIPVAGRACTWHARALAPHAARSQSPAATAPSAPPLCSNASVAPSPSPQSALHKKRN